MQSSGRVIDRKRYTIQVTDEALAYMEQLYNHIAYIDKSKVTKEIKRKCVLNVILMKIG